MKAVVMREFGGTEVMETVERPFPSAEHGQIVVKVAAAGVNFMDIGVRQGSAWTDVPNPKVLGVEGAGYVVAVGSGVDEFAPDDRVAWIYGPGSYSEYISISATSLVRIPDIVDDRIAASIMMQGLTASHFATDFYPVQPGDIALVHAAAGGVGLFLTQIIKRRGGHVIGRVSSPEKAAIVKAAEQIMSLSTGTDSSQMKSCILRMGWVSTSSTTDRDRRLSKTPSPHSVVPVLFAGTDRCWAGPVRSIL